MPLCRAFLIRGCFLGLTHTLFQAGAIQCDADDFENGKAFLRWPDGTAELKGDIVQGVTLLTLLLSVLIHICIRVAVNTVPRRQPTVVLCYCLLHFPCGR